MNGAFHSMFRFLMKRRVTGMFVALSLCLGLANIEPALGQSPPATKPLSFINDVAPILKENCFACHDSKKRKGKLDMSTFTNFRKGGEKDDPIAAGKPDDSLLIDLVTSKEAERM